MLREKMRSTLPEFAEQPDFRPEFREQTNDWKWFKDAWDQNRTNAHGPEWGLIFAETMQGVLKDKEDGTPNAMSQFMHRETSKHLMGGPILRV